MPHLSMINDNQIKFYEISNIWYGDIYKNNIPTYLHESIITEIEDCIILTNVIAHDIIRFLIKDITAYKLLCLMNCSCTCRSIRRINKIKQSINYICNCCYRHNDMCNKCITIIIINIFIVFILYMICFT